MVEFDKLRAEHEAVTREALLNGQPNKGGTSKHATRLAALFEELGELARARDDFRTRLNAAFLRLRNEKRRLEEEKAHAVIDAAAGYYEQELIPKAKDLLEALGHIPGGGAGSGPNKFLSGQILLESMVRHFVSARGEDLPLITMYARPPQYAHNLEKISADVSLFAKLSRDSLRRTHIERQRVEAKHRVA